MTRPELHTVRRPFFDCTTYRRASDDRAKAGAASDLHVHAEMTRPLLRPALSYSEIKVALRLVA